MKKSVVCAAVSLMGLMLFQLMTAVQAEDGANNFPLLPKTPSVAHRGFSHVAPENTLSAIQEAIRIGAAGCEFDVYQTSDGEMFLNHDSSLKRVAGVDIAPDKITFEELRKLDAGAWKGEEFRGEKYPTLREALELLKPTATRPVIEIKADGFEEKLVALVRELGMEKEVIFIDFSAARVKKFREIAPEIPTAWLVSFDKETPTNEACETIEKTLASCGTNVVDMAFNKVSRELLDRLAGRGIHVMCWTVDHPADIARMIDLGVESITSNRPDLVLQALAERKR